MTFRQKLLKILYPLTMRFGSSSPASDRIKKNSEYSIPVVPFFTLQSVLNSGERFSFSSLKGRKVLLVNTASDCGYTAQYGELEMLYERHKDRLIVLGFPANDFREQEKGDDRAIAEFCSVNFGVSFPLMTKSSVVKGEGQNSVYKWLSNISENGWNSQAPVWNFCKYLIDERGVLTHYFEMTVSPLGPEIESAVRGEVVMA